LQTIWDWCASPNQWPPDGDWKTWLFLGGRGAGKTQAGAEWLSGETGPKVRFALVGPTLNHVREVMVEGPSGLLAIADPDKRPRYYPSRGVLKWPDGAIAHAFSAAEPERLRGPQFNAAWCDELCAWPSPEETLALLRMGLRRGSDPRLMISTTPRPSMWLRRLMAQPGVVVTRAPTSENAANLAPDFIETLETLYGGTARYAQEVEGQVLDAAEGALWRSEDFMRVLVPWPERWDRLIVAVDPPVTDKGACGIVAAARIGERAVVLEDASVGRCQPWVWARRVAEVATRLGADHVVAEVNQGGALVRELLVQQGCAVPVVEVHARVGKRLRAEPVAALYQQGRVGHAARFPLLEEEMMALGNDELTHSPDRADALVWAITELLVSRTPPPRIRRVW
jgi:phage terminase large subunit-like protein